MNAWDLDDWPSFNEELTRKTVETLERWTKAYDAERISRREYYIIVSVLYDNTSGMIDMAVSDLMADIHKELKR